MQLRGRLRREVKGRARGSEGSGDELTPAHGTRLRLFDRGAPSSPQPPLVDSLSPEPSRPASLPQGRAGRVSYGSAAVAEHQPPAWVGADRNRAGCGWNDCYGPISASGSNDRKWADLRPMRSRIADVAGDVCIRDEQPAEIDPHPP